jgi:hypothetical protein
MTAFGSKQERMTAFGSKQERMTAFGSKQERMTDFGSKQEWSSRGVRDEGSRACSPVMPRFGSGPAESGIPLSRSG